MFFFFLRNFAKRFVCFFQSFLFRIFSKVFQSFFFLQKFVFHTFFQTMFFLKAICFWKEVFFSDGFVLRMFSVPKEV